MFAMYTAIFLKDKYFFCMYMSVCLSECILVSREVPMKIRREHQMDPLELELQMVVSRHVGTGNQTQVFYKNKKLS